MIPGVSQTAAHLLKVATATVEDVPKTIVGRGAPVCEVALKGLWPAIPAGAALHQARKPCHGLQQCQLNDNAY